MDRRNSQKISNDAKIDNSAKIYDFVNLYGCEIGENSKSERLLKFKKVQSSDLIAKFQVIHLFVKV